MTGPNFCNVFEFGPIPLNKLFGGQLKMLYYKVFTMWPVFKILFECLWKIHLMVCLNNCKLANQSNAIKINSFKNPYKLSHRSLSLSCASHIMGIFSWLFCLRRMRVVLVRVRLNFPIISIYLLNVRIISKIHNKLFILIYGFYKVSFVCALL